MKLIDVSVPLDSSLPVYPGNTPLTVEPIKRLARGDSSNVSTLHLSAATEGPLRRSRPVRLEISGKREGN